MDDIVAVADIHEGANLEGRPDNETGLSERALDIHRNFARAAQYAIEKKSKMFVIAGDMFDRAHVSPQHRELVRRDIIQPLGDAGIRILLLAGNHDQPRSFLRATSLDDYKAFRHVTLCRKPAAELVDIGGKKAGIIALPYMHPEQVIALVEKSEGLEIARGQWLAVAQRVLKGYVAQQAQELRSRGATAVLLFGHYYITGAKLGGTTMTQVLPDEFQFTRDMAQGVDLGVFGHIHVHQQASRDPPLVYTGSVERVDWGEWEEEKGFISVSLAGAKPEWKFVPLPARPMHKIRVRLAKDCADPTSAILAALPENTEGSIVRIELGGAGAVLKSLDEKRILAALGKAFCHEIRYSEQAEEAVAPQSFKADPFSLVDDFLELNYKGSPHYARLRREARELLEEVVK